MHLNGKVAIVTGSSRGIGAACARRLAEDGAALVIHYRQQSADAETVRAGIVAKGGRATLCQADLADPSQIPALVDAAVQTFGRLDILVNNAAIGEPGRIDGMDLAHITRHLSTNITALLLTTQAAVRAFGAGGGCVINMSSINGSRPVPGGSVYSGTKAAVDAITRSLAIELGPRGIRVNAVAPGATDTEMLRAALPPGGEDTLAKRTLLANRLGKPEEIAAVVSFLAGPDGAWITGQVINASGGLQI
jgi:3-oxoacyl-[acyl-carrier protein] reductase